MSKLEKLINELCPNGVEYTKIKDNFNRLKGTNITASKMKQIESEDGTIRVFAGGKTVINTKPEYISNSNIIKVPSVIVQSRGVIDVIYYEQSFTFKNEMWAYTSNEKISVKFLYYVLKNNLQKFRNSASIMSSLPQISISLTDDFLVPLPPLPVQEEIVSILDTFTELTAELTARKKQYEYYRNISLEKDYYPDKLLGDLCKFVRGPFGGSLKKECFQDNGFAVYEQQHAIYGKFDFRW